MEAPHDWTAGGLLSRALAHCTFSLYKASLYIIKCVADRYCKVTDVRHVARHAIYTHILCVR